MKDVVNIYKFEIRRIWKKIRYLFAHLVLSNNHPFTPGLHLPLFYNEAKETVF
jgi:hypothetical protein